MVFGQIVGLQRQAKRGQVGRQRIKVWPLAEYPAGGLFQFFVLALAISLNQASMIRADSDG